MYDNIYMTRLSRNSRTAVLFYLWCKSDLQALKLWDQRVSYSAIMDESITQCLYTGKCSCKEKKLRSVSDLCKTKHDYGE